jgi:hypothetical protein
MRFQCSASLITSCMWCGGGSSLDRAMVLRILPYDELGVPPYPRFPVELSGFREVHAPFLKERRGNSGYLARFSRDVGFRCTATGIRPGCKGATNGRPPHLAKNQRDTPNFLHAAPDKTTCAPFFKERRMKSGEPNQLYRKSGLWGTHGLFAMTGECALLDYLGRGISAVIAGEEAAGCERNRKEQIGGDEHRPKACPALRQGAFAVRARQAPASEPANDGQNRGRRESYEDLQRQGQVAEGHSSCYFRTMASRYRPEERTAE